MTSLFAELGIVLLIGLILSVIFHRFKQPLIIGYILTGILASPLLLNLISINDNYRLFSHIGISLLLFIVGLHMNLKLLKEIGLETVVLGTSQVLFSSLSFSVIVYLFFGYSFLVSILFGFAFSLSSTIIIVKLLSDKKRLDTVSGKITLGILIIQDIFAILFITILSSLGSSHSGNILFLILKKIFFGVGLLCLVLLISHRFVDKVLDIIAESQELFFIFSLAWCFSISLLFQSIGFSLEVGALIAGIALASSPYQIEISSKIKPLRDFFLIIFFIMLGSEMLPSKKMPILRSFPNFSVFDLFKSSDLFMRVISIFFENFKIKISYFFLIFSQIFISAFVFAILVVILKQIIVYVLLNLNRFKEKVAFDVSLNLTQISEFSLIIFVTARELGFVTNNEISFVTLVLILTIFFSTYLITHSVSLFNKVKWFLKFITFRKIANSKNKFNERDILTEIYVFGYDRIGFSLLRVIEKLDRNYLIIDYNPRIIKKLEMNGFNTLYGDVSDVEFLNELSFKNGELFISTIPDFETSLILLKAIRKRNRKGIIILTSHKIDEALELYKEGADYVILPHFLGGDFVSSLIEKYHGRYGEFLKEKIKHIYDLKLRKEHGFDHPRHLH